MKLGGLFSGVGGFELAWTQLGHEIAWMCEWDAKARKVLEARFPGVPIYPDVRDLDPAEVEAVDVLTGGSPCQGFSVAGNRTGLEHSESQLFRDYIRIMDGLAERGLQYAVWENVPGVLSITNDDGERTFEHVVTALAGGTEPVRFPADKRWNTGLASGRGRAVAWRVLDSRYFGVAQRRRRIFACVAFGDSCEDRAGRTLLAVSEGVRGDSSSSVQAGEGVAGGVRGGVEGASRAGVLDVSGPLTLGIGKGARGSETSDSGWVIPDVAATVTSKWAKGSGGPSGSETGNMVLDTAETVDFGRTSDRIRIGAETAATLQAGGGGAGANTGLYMVPQAFRKSARAQSSEDGESWVEDGQANTLNVFDTGDTRTTHAIVEPTPIQDTREVDKKQNGLGVGQPGDPSFTLDTTSRAGFGAAYGVRRLTPVECERLQSFPDGWTEPAGSDSARYKAMGNAVTVNVVRWILSRFP